VNYVSTTDGLDRPKFVVRHAIPGRIRLFSRLLGVPSPLADAMLEWLRTRDWIISARCNHAAASLILEYDPAKEARLQELLSRLQHAAIGDLRMLAAMVPARSVKVASAQSTSEKHVELYQPKRWPLALPTVSLALAFVQYPLSLAIKIPLMLFTATPIFRRAWRALRREQRLNIDFLDTLAIGASIGQGNFITGGAIIWLIHLGDYMRDLTAAGSKKAMNELLDFQSKTAWRVTGNDIVEVKLSELAAGDVVIVYHGELIPVDGEIIRGRALIDQQMITGESLPVARGEGEETFAGTVVRDGQITIRSRRVGRETVSAQVARLVADAPIGDTRMQNHAERLADQLVAPTLGLAVGSAMVTADLDRFLSLVIVDYGTGIRIAAPTTVLSSITHAARCGIIVKGGRHLERLADVDTIVFDKTGTLTRGVPIVREIVAYSSQISANQLLAIAVAAETRLKHPVAEALRLRAAELGVAIPDCTEADFHVGLGVEGNVDGRYVHVGSERFIRQSDIRLNEAGDGLAAINERGESCIFVAVDGELVGLVSYADQIREESRSVIERLHALGIRDTFMLTGDNAVVAAAVGERLGMTGYFSALLPADKVETIQRLQREGRVVAMIGDGINDSPALSFADVGVAMKHGADIAHESADIVLLEDSLWKLVQAVEISRNAIHLIKQNYAVVVAMNTVALGLALPGGLISARVTALISNGSAILAALNGMRPLLSKR
jgi:heavy metal translocating P-type ATPase